MLSETKLYYSEQARPDAESEDAVDEINSPSSALVSPISSSSLSSSSPSTGPNLIVCCFFFFTRLLLSFHFLALALQKVDLLIFLRRLVVSAACPSWLAHYKLGLFHYNGIQPHYFNTFLSIVQDKHTHTNKQTQIQKTPTQTNIQKYKKTPTHTDKHRRDALFGRVVPWETARREA